MDKTSLFFSLGLIIGATIFLGFFGLSRIGYYIFDIPYLGDFLAMIGLLLFFISGFFLFSLKVPKY